MTTDDDECRDGDELERAYYAALDEAVAQRTAEHAQMGTDFAEMEAAWRALGFDSPFPF